MLQKILANFSCRLLIGIIFVSITTTNALASPCAGQVNQNRDTAQANFRTSCGQQWNDQLRHQCTWVDSPKSGFICHEYAPNGLATISPEETAPPAESASLSKPYPIHAQAENDFVSVVWRKDAGAHGVNVYRNNQWLASVNYPGTVYNDRTGQSGDSYYLIAYDRDGNFSERSIVFSVTNSRRPYLVEEGSTLVIIVDDPPPITEETYYTSDNPPLGDSSGYPATPRTPYIISVTPSTRSAVITWTIPYTTAENVYCELHIYNVATGERTTGRGRIQCPGHGRRTITIGDRGDSLSPNTEYLVRVRASNAQGQTSWSRAFRFRTQLVPYTP
jgi:hypothetical protein